MSIQQLAYETLHTTYKKTFEDVNAYARSNFLSGDKYEEAMFNLYDVLFQAQTDGKPVEKLVGYDIQQFCQQYFGDTTILEKVITIFVRLVFSVVSIFGVEWLFFSSQAPFNLGKALTVGVIWLMWERVLLESSNAFFKQKNTTMALGLFSVVGILAIYTIVDIPQFAFFIPREITMWGLLVVELIIFTIYQLVPSNRKKARKYVKQLLKKQRKDKFSKEFQVWWTEILERRFEKHRQKNSDLTWHMFLQAQQKKEIKEHKILKAFSIGIIIVAFLSSLFIMKDTLVDVALFTLLNAGLTFMIYRFFKQGMQYKLNVLTKLLGEEHHERI